MIPLKKLCLMCFGFSTFYSTVRTLYWLTVFLSEQRNVDLFIMPNDRTTPKIEIGSNGEIRVWEPFLAKLWAIIWDLFLVIVFVFPHSLLANDWVKNLYKNSGFECIERCVYVSISNFSLQMLMSHWQPIYGYALWDINTKDHSFLGWMFTLIHFFSWLFLYANCLHMDLPEMIGVKQIYYYINNHLDPLTYKSSQLRTLYKNKRHPSFVLFILILWVFPTMRLDRFFLTLTLTIYMMCGFCVTEENYFYIKDQMIKKSLRLMQQFNKDVTS